MDKQDKSGSNAVDEEQKAASARNGRQSAPSTRLPLGECARIRQKTQSASTNVKANTQQRRSARYTTISAITGRVIRENTVVKKVPRDMVRVSPS